MIDLLSIPPALLIVLAAIVVPFVSRRLAHGVGVVALLAVLGWALAVPAGTGPSLTFLGYEVIVVAVDDFTRLMAIIFGGFGAAAVAWAYSADADNRHLLLGLGYVGASLWTVMVGDWLGLIVGWEVMAIASTVFVWLSGGDAVRAGFRYALIHALGGSLLLAGIVLHLFAVGPDPTALHFDGGGITTGLPAILAGIGIGVNTAIIGFHSWLPDTYPRPHVATSVFLCCFTTKTAVYAMYRAFPEGNVAVAYMGGAMAIYGATFALAQKDMRKLLAYHIQSQVGFMLAGIGVGSALGIAGGFAHLFNHILYKGLLFMAAGILIIQLGRNRLDNFGALGTSTPIALVLFLVGALSITGVPGFNGFVSKGMIMDAAGYGGFGTLEYLLFVGSVGTFASFIKFGYYAFLDGEPITSTDANMGHTIAGGSLAVACIAFGVFYQPLFSILPMAGAFEQDPYTTTHVLKALGLGVGGLVAFVAAKPVIGRLHGAPDVNSVHDPLAFYGTRAVSGGLGAIYNAFRDFVVETGWRVVGVLHEPAPAIRAVLPDGWRARYDDRLEEIPGKTGGKLGIGRTMYVATGLLALVLAVTLFI